jgi:hypothetical protein
MELAPTLAGIRVTITVENATASCATQAVFQTTSDGHTWANPVALDPSFVAGNRVATTTAWATSPGDFLRGIRIGLLVQQSSGTAVESCKVTMTVDFLLRS